MLVCSYDHVVASSSHKCWGFFVSFESVLLWRTIWHELIDGGLLFSASFKSKGSFNSTRSMVSAPQK